MLSDLYAEFEPSQLSLVVRASPGKLIVVDSSTTRGSQLFFEKKCFSRVVLCCVALPFCCVVVVALLSQHLIVHVCDRREEG